MIKKTKLKNRIDLEWYQKHVRQITSKAGPRYTSELNVSLPISEIFDGVSRTERFYTEIRVKYGELLREFNYISSHFENVELQKTYNEIRKGVDVILNLISKIKGYSTSHISWNVIQKQASISEEEFWEFVAKLSTAKEQIKETQSTTEISGSHRPSASEKLDSDIRHAYKVQELVRYFERFASSSKAQLSNQPFLLLTGSAGTGKTHLLCDLVEQRTTSYSQPLPTFLTFGESFTDKKRFWHQILEQLELPTQITRKETLLKELDRLGRKAKSRTIIIIDALNENINHAPNFWKNNLDSIIADIRKYPNIALVISVRSKFENEVLLPRQIALFIQEEHSGFRFSEWEAVNKFFSAYKLPLPEIPLLMPEFQNPLFLILFCKAFEKKALTDKQIFRGHSGATYIFERYVDTVSKPIEDEFHISHAPRQNIWDTLIKGIAEAMVFQKDSKISEEELIDIIKNNHPKIEISRFLHSLEVNMLIVKVPRYEDGKRTNGFDIRFPFQKFSDHLIGRYIFKKYEEEFGKQNKNITTAQKFFSKSRKLGKLLQQSYNRGIIEALSIQCPEQLRGVEFIEIVPYLSKDTYFSQMLDDSFVESIIWRNPQSFSADNKNALEIINRRIIKTEDGKNQLQNALLSIAPIPNHPFNATFLHRHLEKQTMPKRDSWWSTFLHYQYGEHGAVDRLIEWSWSAHDYSHIKDESIFLTCIALSWFLTTPNRFVRDKATKGLVCLLQNRINLLPQILEKFKNINDIYIFERLLAVAYGSVLRNQADTLGLKNLADWVYTNIFKDNKPPVHILLRDYARGVIEVALERGVEMNINVENIRPPYKSIWPKRIPSEKLLKKKYYPEEFFKETTKERGFLDIWSSTMSAYGTMGDFGRYIIGSRLDNWSGRKISDLEPNRKKLLEVFKKNLTSKQRKLFSKATSRFSDVSFSELLKYIDELEPGGVASPSEEEVKKKNIAQKIKQKKSNSEFVQSLPKEKRSYYRKEIAPFLDDNGNINDPFDRFDLALAQRWIFSRVVSLGYEPALHNKFDSNAHSYVDRREHKSERIGKKYQWIAYHEFLALLCDHFEFTGARWNESSEGYKGPWNPNIRDIDASFVLYNDLPLKQTVSFSDWAGSHGHYNSWRKTKSDVAWIKTNNDLPNPREIVKIADNNKKKWLTLKGIFVWQEDTPPEYKKYDIPRRELFYILKSFIVKKGDLKTILKWIAKKGFGNWLPESNDFYEAFIGEYPNSASFDDLRGDCNIWINAKKDLNVPVVVTDDSYLNQFTLDCSHSGSVSIKLPNKWLVNNLNIKQLYLDGRFYDKESNLVALTTNIFEENSRSPLLIDSDLLVNFLDKNGYAIFWTLLGEKQLIGGNLSRRDSLGRLEVSGIYTTNDRGKIVGRTISKLKK